MFVGCPVTSSSLSLHKTMNNEPFPNQHPNPNPPMQRQIDTVSLLGSDASTTTTNHHSSIKRTLSADMSSPKWLKNNGFSSPMKRVQSFDRLNATGQEEDELNKQIFANEDDQKKLAFEDIWSSILSHKGSGSGQTPPPYVHPMVKRTTSSLSEKSLEICTESLGSETGSDGFSFMVSSGPEDTGKDSETIEDQHVEHVHESPMCGPNDEPNESSPTSSLSQSLGPRLRSSFPPPLPSLANHNGSNVEMRSHRQNGRLVLEAVAVPSQNCLKAQRQDGRLLLTLSGDDDDDGDDDESSKDHLELEDNALEVKYDDKVEEGDGSHLNSPMEMVNVKQVTTPVLIMSKFKWLNSTRPRNVNATVFNDRSEVDQHKSLLPPRPKTAHVVSKDGPMSTTTTNSVLNGYEYYWRQSTTVIGVLKPLARQQKDSAALQVVEKESNYMNKLLLEHGNGKVVVVKGDQREKEGEYLVPFLRGCKVPKRSLLLWEPHCIATS